ncbi:hypothetical protein L7F22_037543 [Adiantum nelumboides]|nr:hypothetical protein [Adiantum nelumboides]
MEDASPTPAVESKETGIFNALNSIDMYSPLNQPPASPGEKVFPPTWNMFDFFVKCFLQSITNLGGDLSPDLLKFYQYFQKFRDIAFTRFCTSSEEKGTIDSYHSKIFQREEKESNFNAKHTELVTLLKQLQVENRDSELSLRGKKEQSADEVRNSLDEYNQDLQMRKEDLQKLRVSATYLYIENFSTMY